MKMTTTTLTRTRFNAANAVAWTLQILCGLMFVFAGGTKLAGQQHMVETFQVIGLGQWFRYLTGLIEVGGGLLLFVPALAFYAASALVVTMVGAVITHLFIIGGSPVAAFVLLVATATIAYLRRPNV
jgi:putative oxidoreductase